MSCFHFVSWYQFPVVVSVDDVVHNVVSVYDDEESTMKEKKAIC